MRHFFITGPGRCRTAWLAAFLSHSHVHCFHEASKLASDGEEFQRLLRTDLPHTIVGDSDSGLCLNIEWFLARYPTSRYLVIDRPFSHVVGSFHAHFGVNIKNSEWERIFHVYCEARKQLVSHPMARHVLFDDLHSESTIRDIWDWCTYGSLWIPSRYALFKDLVIQVPKTYDLSSRSGFQSELIKSCQRLLQQQV